ncbi:MAG: aldo/keto reductase [Pirellulaceae bacterium]
MDRRRIGTTDIMISPVAMGCWPIAGMTSLNVNEMDSLATLKSAFDHGVNFFDTAYCYGANGESERLIDRALGEVRDQIVIATKGGIAWNAAGQRVQDASPATLRRHCEESLKRLATDRVELYYLHGPDPKVPVEESAIALKRLMDEGKARCIGVSNFNVDQLQAFHAVCPITAVQPHYNMLQRDIESDIVPWCRRHSASLMVYWPLMKGLLAGKLARDHRFDPADGRAKYPMFQGEEYQKNQDFVDVLRVIAEELQRTVADVVINWTIHQPGITAALCGAKRPHQIEESAKAMAWKLPDSAMRRIDQAIIDRGPVVGKSAV